MIGAAAVACGWTLIVLGFLVLLCGELCVVPVGVCGVSLLVPCASPTAPSSCSQAWVVNLELFPYSVVSSGKIRGAFRVGRLGLSWPLVGCTSRGLDASLVPRVGGRDLQMSSENSMGLLSRTQIPHAGPPPLFSCILATPVGTSN
jgi:hypothetical protein